MLSYCLIPAIIAAIALPIALSFASQSLFSEIGGGSVDLDPDLSPSFALDFASSMIISNAFAISFGVWVIVLFAKATKIANGFENKKSILIVISALAAMYAVTILLGLVISLLSFWIVPMLNNL